MRRRLALPLVLLSPLALNACGFVVMHTARKIYKDSTQQEAAVEQALARYREALLKNDAAQAAAFYTEDAELSQGDVKPFQGRPAILASLKQPDGWRVSQVELKAASTEVDGDRAVQRGSFLQKSIADPGRTLELRGRFEARWVRKANDWLMARLHTDLV